MNRIAVISDVHACNARLEGTLRDLEREGIDHSRTFLCGDLVIKGIHPAEETCVRCVSEKGLQVVSGNHDTHVVWKYSSEATRPERNGKPILSRESIAFLRSLPLCIRTEDLLFAHSLPVGSLNRIVVADDAKKALEGLDGPFTTARRVFIGHVPVPMAFEYDPEARTCTFVPGSLTLREDRRYLIVTGALNDMPTGTYLVYDPGTGRVERRSVR